MVKKLEMLFAEADYALQHHFVTKEAQEKNNEELRSQNGKDFGVAIGTTRKSTYDKNFQICKRFIRQTRRSHPELNELHEFKPYVCEYLSSQLEAGNDRRSVKREGQAIARLFDCSFSDFDFDLPRRKKKERTIYDIVHEITEAEVNHYKHLALAATGLKSTEVPYLQRNHFFEDEGFLFFSLSGLREDAKIINPKYQFEFKEYLKRDKYISGNSYQLFPKELFIGASLSEKQEYFCDGYKFFELYGRFPGFKPDYSKQETYKARNMDFRYQRDVVEFLMQFDTEKRMYRFIGKYLLPIAWQSVVQSAV